MTDEVCIVIVQCFVSHYLIKLIYEFSQCIRKKFFSLNAQCMIVNTPETMQEMRNSIRPLEIEWASIRAHYVLNVERVM